MNNTSKNLIFTILAVVVVLVIVILLPKDKSADKLKDFGPEMDRFAKCLNDKQAVMYGVYWCSACKAQKEDFGASFQFVNYFECADDPQTCQDKKIEYTPTWILENGDKLVGKQPLEVLAEKTGCPLPENLN